MRCALLLLCIALPCAPIRAARADPTPSRFDLFRLLMRQQALPLGRVSSCKGVVPAVKAPTLGDWIAYNLSLLQRGAIELPASCRASEDGRAWSCEVSFAVVNKKENVLWRWGVRFALRKSDRSLVPGSLVCTGAG